MISDTYSEIILEQIIREMLLAGIAPTVGEITRRYNTFVAANDISKPLFLPASYIAVKGEPASATTYNNALLDIERDLKVLYKELFKVSSQILLDFQRERAEGKLLEGQLDTLQDRITNLLLLSTDAEGFFNFVQDNFTDTSLVDLVNSTTYIDTSKGIITLGTNSIGPTRIDLSYLQDKDILFTVLSRTNLISAIQSEGSRLIDGVSDTTGYWQERIHMSKPGAVSAEFKINLRSTIDLSRLDIVLHSSNQSSAIQITPMYSIDNYNWLNLPLDTFSRSITTNTSFRFTPISAQWIKLILSKSSYDQVSRGQYNYEFGLDSISLFNEGFATITTGSTFYSQVLSVKGTNDLPEEFGKVALEVCEEVPTGTSVDYSIAVFNDPNLPIASNNFINIDPLGRSVTVNPTSIDFGDLSPITMSGVVISYNPSSAIFVNPSQTFSYLSSISGGAPLVQTAVSSDTRYSFLKTNERLLSLSVSPGIQIAQNTLEVWRNVHILGSLTKVRNNIAGWRFEDPYYKTTVEVINAQGFDVDWGSKSVVLDGATISGKVNIPAGAHSLWVHRNSWQFIDLTNVVSLATLKAADQLYPYNHRYIVEGLAYPSIYPITEDKVYRGFDIIAEYRMQEVSVFDLMNNIGSSDYIYFARDLDAGDASLLLDGSPATGIDTEPLTVFLVKVDENSSDALDELYTIRLKAVNTSYKYLRLKAVLKTTDPALTPLVDAFRIKVAN